MTNDYSNAKNLLPPELLAEVQKFCSGLVWIPAPNRQSGRKRRIATQMLRTGMTSGDIRKLIDISPRHLRRLAREVHAAPPSLPSTASGQ
nr:MAG TPA: Mor transcription activator family [Caudoviricetes sp.]